MAHVVFLRGANVAGQKVFRPAEIARALSHLGCVSVGAAGTFVFRTTAPKAQITAELTKLLPFATETMICPANDVIALHARYQPKPSGLPQYVTVMDMRPAKHPRLPIAHPSGAKWQTRVIQLEDRFAISERRATGPRVIYPNEIVEREFGVPATTRSWSTLAKVCSLLES